ncbi:MAG: DUF2783 domain-containing protein [Alphaproteobacteria bacterium RIFCSPHIGHO2_12_FULL_63_12]|nr:MAG: DUF2783 domain-containing protein [Alphaproteobacteria bacterium RIFCSPHIGHO2_12_FULL_63_12]
MGKLNTLPNVADPDSLYQKLIEAHAGLSDAQSTALNARLILLLINHIGDKSVIEEAIDAAKGAKE